ncbi:MAG: hypothetical protein OZSIB_2218 [Candidatus Ozemobacter sibiricus]|uniref:Uncharacterized protein n=1 Tax=Candidatus Ozemobacter sibiricus TaxID=2268124 RepID=A0A367ZUF6_9BACT|nr:MAG: hypothetical protein OZSIB_2218 [Candidatus Ozemobacter sibiricus]
MIFPCRAVFVKPDPAFRRSAGRRNTDRAAGLAIAGTGPLQRGRRDAVDFAPRRRFILPLNLERWRMECAKR